MRIIFCGTSSFAVPSLEQLISREHTVVSCVTQPDRPRGRGLRLEPSAVKQAALRLRLPLVQPERLTRAMCEPLHADVGVVMAYGQLIGHELLTLPRHGMIGVHPSLLPAYRGAAPVAWALLNGETTTGVTIFRLSERLDAGEIIFRRPVSILPEEHADALTERLAHLGAEDLLRALEALARGQGVFEPQDESRATFAPKLTKAQGRIDWRTPAESVVRLVRATTPWPGAATEWQGQPFRIWAASPAEAAASREVTPGTIVQVMPQALAVAAGKGTVIVTEVQPQGRRRMSVQEFLAGHRVTVGEQLGE